MTCFPNRRCEKANPRSGAVSRKPHLAGLLVAGYLEHPADDFVKKWAAIVQKVQGILGGY